MKDRDIGSMAVWSIHAYGEALYGPRYQRELAEALSVSERTMRRWVAGDTSPPGGVITDLEKLARERINLLRSLLKRQ